MRGGTEGFTLIEVLISISIFSIVLLAIFNLYISYYKNYGVREQIVRMNQRSRIIRSILTKQVQMAGYAIIQSFSIIPGDGGAGGNPDSISIIANFTDTPYAIVTKDMPGTASVVDVDTIANFAVGDLVVVSDGADYIVVQLTKLLPSLKIQYNPSSDFNYPSGLGKTYLKDISTVTKIGIMSYSIDTSDPDNPRLMRDLNQGGGAELLAEGVENMQIQYVLNNGTTVDSPTSAQIQDIRQINFTLTVRTNKPDSDYSGDGYRRRIVRFSVYIRNSGI